MTQTDLASALSDEQLQILKDIALDFALSNGLVIRPVSKGSNIIAEGVINAPVTLFPSYFPLDAYDSAVKLQPLYNQLVHDISQDDAFLREIMER